jgi:hypothetical protein
MPSPSHSPRASSRPSALMMIALAVVYLAWRFIQLATWVL